MSTCRRGDGRDNPRDRRPHRALTGRRVLITGGSSGIGAATARAFAERDARVAVAGRDEEALRRIAARTGGVCLPGDLSQRTCPGRTVNAAVEALGGLDIVVSNAGIGWAGRFANMDEPDIDALLDVNLRAPAHLARAAIPHLEPRRGRLVFVGSIAGLVGAPHEVWYSATKAGLRSLTDLLRAELRPAGVGVSLVSPGAVDTAFFERRHVPYARRRPRRISAEAVAHAIVGVVERGKDEAVIPAWLSLPALLRANFPGLYRQLAARLAE